MVRRPRAAVAAAERGPLRQRRQDRRGVRQPAERAEGRRGQEEVPRQDARQEGGRGRLNEEGICSFVGDAEQTMSQLSRVLLILSSMAHFV